MKSVYYDQNNGFFIEVWQDVPLTYIVMIHLCYSAPLSKNAKFAFQISCKVLSFTLKDYWRNQQTINALQELKAISIISNVCIHTTFYHSSGLTRTLMFNGSIYCVLYLQILRFYLVRQYCCYTLFGHKIYYKIELLAVLCNKSLNFHFITNKILVNLCSCSVWLTFQTPASTISFLLFPKIILWWTCRFVRAS